MSNEQHAQEIAMLRAEIEMLMSERQALLRATGAAAVFVANLDSESLPEDTYAVADILAHALNDLSKTRCAMRSNWFSRQLNRPAQNRKSNNNGSRSGSIGRVPCWKVKFRPRPKSA